MKRAIRNHRVDFVAIAALCVAAISTVPYILEHQPSFTFGQSYYVVKAPFTTAAAVTPGQGQAVTIAGVEVGLVGGVSLHDGDAVVTMDIFKRYAPIYRNATVLLRPRTPLKDMYLALDPGTRAAGAVPAGGTLSLANTQPDIDVDQILSSLDADTREYLLLLLSGGAQAFGGKGAHGGTPSPVATSDLAAIFKRFVPLDRNTESFASACSPPGRRTSAGRSTTSTSSSARSAASTRNWPRSCAPRTPTSGRSPRRTPRSRPASPSCRRRCRRRARRSPRSAASPAPPARRCTRWRRSRASSPRRSPRCTASRTTPPRRSASSCARSPLPSSRSSGARSRGVVARDLDPHLTNSVGVLNGLFNTLAYQPGGGQSSYLFWGSWLAHIADSLTSSQDANGPILRGLFMASCPQLNLLELTLTKSDPALTPILDLLNAPDWSRSSPRSARRDRL